MAPTVGLIGHNGFVGKAILKELAAAQQAGKVKLVVIHRPSSSTATVPASVEKRAIDSTKPDGADYDRAVAGLNALVSAVGAEGISAQYAFYPALKRSADFKLFIPSDFGVPWTKDEIADINYPAFKDKEDVIDKAVADGIPFATIKVGAITDLTFSFPGIWDVKGNKATTYGNGATAKVAFTSTAYIAAGVRELLSRDLSSSVGKDYGLVEEWRTNNEIYDIITKLHSGAATKVETLDDATLKSLLANDNPFVALVAGLQRKIAKGLNYDHQTPLEVADWKAKPVADYIKDQA